MKLPTFILQLKKVTIAYAAWVAAGRPKRSPQAIEQLFEFCQKCPSNQYIRITANNGKCNACKCHLKRTPGGLNKLELLTEGCPRGYWPAQVKEPK